MAEAAGRPQRMGTSFQSWHPAVALMGTGVSPVAPSLAECRTDSRRMR